MRGEVFKYLRSNYSTEPEFVDKLIVTSFIKANALKVSNNTFLKQYIIKETDEEAVALLVSLLSIISEEVVEFDFEVLIEFFEFIVSPADKIVNGAVYTPKYIRDYIVDKALTKTTKDIKALKVCDISCGCGGFLLTLADEIHKKTGKRFYDIYKENVYGIDITEYSITRAKLLLSLYALANGEDIDLVFNLKVGNSLTYDWREECTEIKENDGFDIIAGNPPYVSSRNMDKCTLALMSKWQVTASGHPDLYIPFFQIGYEHLNSSGILGLITVNTFIKSLNGRALRQYFAENKVDLTIINFGGEQLFKDRNTYTCVCFLSKKSGHINYIRIKSDELDTLNDSSYKQFSYENLNHFDGWNLVNTELLNEYITIIEATGQAFIKRYTTRNGIATLRNDIYKFRPVEEDESFYYLKEDDNLFKIEKALCRDIVNANKLKTERDLTTIREKIIFPYNQISGETNIIEEDKFTNDFPHAYHYLHTKKEILAERDKGKRKYEAWYAYGRKQSMDINAYKLFFPHICERPTFVLSLEKDLLFYNGIAVVSTDLEELYLLKKLLESDVFYQYIRSTTKDYSSGYISMSRNYLKNFGVYEFSEFDRAHLLTCQDSNLYIKTLYGVNGLIEFNEYSSIVDERIPI